MTDDVAAPDVVEPLLGFRVWRVEPTSLTLFSVTRGSVPKQQPRMRALMAAPEGAWPHDKPLVAECAQRDRDGNTHTAPDVNCTCGIYATYDLDVIAGYVRKAPILGLVQGFGHNTVPHDDGFRAQSVKITCLFGIAVEFTVPRRELDRLAARYGVPVITPHSDRIEDYRHGVRSGFAPGWELDFEAGSPDAA